MESKFCSDGLKKGLYSLLSSEALSFEYIWWWVHKALQAWQQFLAQVFTWAGFVGCVPQYPQTDCDGAFVNPVEKRVLQKIVRALAFLEQTKFWNASYPSLYLVLVNRNSLYFAYLLKNMIAVQSDPSFTRSHHKRIGGGATFVQVVLRCWFSKLSLCNYDHSSKHK